MNKASFAFAIGYAFATLIQSADNQSSDHTTKMYNIDEYNGTIYDHFIRICSNPQLLESYKKNISFHSIYAQCLANKILSNINVNDLIPHSINPDNTNMFATKKRSAPTENLPFISNKKHNLMITNIFDISDSDSDDEDKSVIFNLILQANKKHFKNGNFNVIEKKPLRVYIDAQLENLCETCRNNENIK
jgi:hypothetical protein